MEQLLKVNILEYNAMTVDGSTPQKDWVNLTDGT